MRALPAILALAGCTTNQSGDFEASKTGDLSHPLATRIAPDAEDLDRCGTGELVEETSASIDRAPYLQQVTSTGVRVLWTQREEPMSIAVTAATPVGEATALTLAAKVSATAVMDGAPAEAGAAAYQAAITGLEPDTLYCYQLVSQGEPVTELAGFRTAPAPGVGARVAFAALGDSGYPGADQDAIAEQLDTVPLRFLLHTGDIAYESGTLAQLESTFFDAYAGFLRSFAAFPSIGNHDDGAVFRAAFDLPRAGDHNWYSFDYGDVHFVALDTNDMSESQAAWLEEDLSATERAWKVVFGHHPPYSSGEHGSSARFRELFGPILERYRVDLVLSGHDHDYERMVPQNGVNYVVTGGGGRGTRPVGTSSFTAFSEAVLHFVYVEVQGDELLLHAIDATGVEFDQLAISHAG